MIPVTADVSNAIAKYQEHFKYRIQMEQVARYETEADFLHKVSRAIENNDPFFGGAPAETKHKARKKKTAE